MALEDSLIRGSGSEDGGSTPSMLDFTKSMTLTREAHFRVGDAYQILNKPDMDIDEILRYLGEAETMYTKALKFSSSNESAKTGLDTVKRLKEEARGRTTLVSMPAISMPAAETFEQEYNNERPSIYILVETSDPNEKTRGSKNEAGINAAATVPSSTELLHRDDISVERRIEKQLMNYSGIDKLTIFHMVNLLGHLGHPNGGASIQGVYTEPVGNISRNQTLYQIPVEELRNYLLSDGGLK